MGDNITHVFATGGTFNVSMQILRDDGSVYCQKGLTVVSKISCSGTTGKRTATHSFQIANGAKFRMDVSIWVAKSNITPAGATMEIYKKFQIKKYTFSCQDIEVVMEGKILATGTCLEENANVTAGAFNPVVMSITAGATGNNGTSGKNDRVKIPGQLWGASYRVTLNDEDIFFPSTPFVLN